MLLLNELLMPRLSICLWCACGPSLHVQIWSDRTALLSTLNSKIFANESAAIKNDAVFSYNGECT